MMQHCSVLLNETIAALNVKPQGIYVDATFGRGGHSELLLSHLGAEGSLIVWDQDEAAIAAATKRYAHDARVKIIHANFGELETVLKAMDVWGKVDGLLFDLGISSPQVDEAQRGFSFLRDGPLDMRMDQSRGLPLSAHLQTLTVTALTRILRDYGEERFAPKIAQAILAAPLHTTTALAERIAAAVPKKFHDPHKHPATRSFQALRIFVNDELAMLEKALACLPAILAVGGRVAFISFHSLEDRPVKARMRFLTTPPQHARGIPIRSDEEGSPPMRICIKMQKPGESEIAANPRARSSVLRVMERIR